MDLLCYLHPGWTPLIRPAEATRAWMDATPEAFAYRCLPLNIANAHGWEVLCPCDAEISWNGGMRTEDVVVRLPPAPQDGLMDGTAPVALFGQATVTFHIQALFRTPPGWDLWITGPPNSAKDGIAPLSAVVETDWSPYTFTMNWRFTRRNHRVRFQRGEPICFVFPVLRGALERFRPKLVPLEHDPALLGQFQAWSASRTAFQAEIATTPPRAPADKWQKRYYRGMPMPGGTAAPDHRARLRLAPFAPGTPDPAAPSLVITEAILTGLLRAARDGGLAQALHQAGLPPGTAERVGAAV